MARERPILFSAPMVLALLAGTKTVTRRIVRPQPVPIPDDVWREKTSPGVWWPSNLCKAMVEPRDMGGLGPYGSRGDRLWVKETWADCMFRSPGEAPTRLEDGRVEGIEYRASHDCRSFEDGCPCNPDGDGKRSEWRPSIYMFRWASRLTLEVTDVRVERLHDITEEDARAEGIDGDASIPARINGEPGTVHCFGDDAARKAFALLWDGLNGKRAPWKSNPWIWRVGFSRVEPALPPEPKASG